ncbi:LCP family protein [Anaeromicropila herbilytica]|uniref:LytR family transcriptional regulator n=1 Tax=Anaeromicropila herbilytica TaxID=2785025 RepID=A0A7R7EP38_9FIRM|nr:LCP family protein [Anaeromicropila herbilytica]BCN32042.1 LytR family transcriptional regulator [Anaeromicropila herbilytica]
MVIMGNDSREKLVSNNVKNDREILRRKELLKKKKRKKMIRRTVHIVLICLAVLIGWGAARLQLEVTVALNSINRDNVKDLSTVNVDEDKLTSDKKIINILLVGSDKRAEWTQAGRSDSTMIATLDLKHRKLKLTSLMRDMYVPIPGHDNNKFNAAYSFGGVSLLYQTIASDFGLKLDGYVLVDFEAFKAVINKVGGVKIELTDAEYEYLTTAYKKGPVLKLKRGVNIMNGSQALAYSRIRQDNKGDFGRTERQRKVLQAIFTEAKSMSLTDLLGLVEELMPYISTDLSNDEIISYLKSIVMLGTTTINQMRIPIDNSYTQDRINNMAVLIPDMDTNIKALNDFIFESSDTQE